MLPIDATSSASSWNGRAVFLLIVVLALALHLPSLLQPQLLYDDFEILLASWTMADTRANLWLPMNEHSWPLMRLTTAGVVEMSGQRQSWLPVLAALPARFALVGALVLLSRFVARHTQSELAGLVAALVFGVTAAYQEALYWYAAHPPLWTTCCAILGINTVRNWEQFARRRDLVMLAVWSFLAPAWFAGGVLIGPLLALYLGLGVRRWAVVVPMLGTVAYLTLTWAMAGEQINRPEHFGGNSMLGSLQPLTGAALTARAIVDQVLLAAFGVFQFAAPIPIVAGVLPLMLGVTVWWWQRAADRRLVVLGCAFIVSNFWLIYSARAEWSYTGQLKDWSRYNVFPWFGLALVVVGGPRWSVEAITRRQAMTLTAVAVALFAVQLRRALYGSPWVDPDQPRILRHLEDLDRSCVEHRISASAARLALPALRTEYWYDDRNCHELLWGGDNPVTHSPEEILKLLKVRVK